MDEFTTDEKQRIDMLYGTDFEEIKPEDAKLIARYEAWKTRQETLGTIEAEQIRATAENNRANANEYAKQAMQALEDMKVAALARLESIENG